MLAHNTKHTTKNTKLKKINTIVYRQVKNQCEPRKTLLTKASPKIESRPLSLPEPDEEIGKQIKTEQYEP